MGRNRERREATPWTGVLVLFALAHMCGGLGCGDDVPVVRDAGVDAGQHLDGGPEAGMDAAGLAMGLLQFDVTHNLEDDTCLSRGDCDLTLENETNTQEFLARVRAESNMAVLHWDRPIPWLVFDRDPPADGDVVAFYDGLLDARLKAWLDSFVEHFGLMDRRYLAVSMLNSSRSRVLEARIDADLEDIPVGGDCPDLSPGTVLDFDYDPGTGPVHASFDLERAYGNFLRYLARKFQPDYMALLVEANLFKEHCPDQWPGLVDLYHRFYDDMRAILGPDVPLFATVTLTDLLGYDVDACTGLQFEPCTTAPEGPNYGTPDPDACYPLNLSAIRDLDQGDRLDILALSFYPDALLMDTGTTGILRFYPTDWDGSADCTYRTYQIPLVDPFAALDRFGWTKPMAIAELGARSCATMVYIPAENSSFLLQLPASAESQAFWLRAGLTTAVQRGFEFYVQSFYRDYPPIGVWMFQQGFLDPFGFSALNTFVCMGLYQQDGTPKDEVRSVWEEFLTGSRGN